MSPDWFELKVAIWDEVNQRNRGLALPTLVFYFLKHEPFLNPTELASRKRTPIYIKAVSDHVRVVTESGDTFVVMVPEFKSEFVLVDEPLGKLMQIPLTGVQPQSLKVEVPDFLINGKLVKGGTMSLNYVQQTQYGGC